MHAAAPAMVVVFLAVRSAALCVCCGVSPVCALCASPAWPVFFRDVLLVFDSLFQQRLRTSLLANFLDPRSNPPSVLPTISPARSTICQQVRALSTLWRTRLRALQSDTVAERSAVHLPSSNPFPDCPLARQQVEEALTVADGQQELPS